MSKREQPARLSGRGIVEGTFESVEFARARDKRRRANKLARESRRKNRR